MPREIIYPTPLWQHTGFNGPWVYPTRATLSPFTSSAAFLGYSACLLAFYSYLDRRSLYVYQRYDPRTVDLPWLEDFKKQYAH